MSNIYVGDSGILFTVNLIDDKGAVPLTSATSIVAKFIKADGAPFSKVLSATDAINGVCNTTLVKEDLTAAGTHSFQVTVTFVGGSEFSSRPQEFYVRARI